jgi:hypothetical protein
MKQLIVLFTLILFSTDLLGAIHYVSLSSSNPVTPFLTWDTAATSIQAAVDAASDGDTVLVTNGVYNTGGVLLKTFTYNRVAVRKPLLLQSVNGPNVTIIQGDSGPTRCVYLTNGAVLSGFTLTNGSTWGSAVYGVDSFDSAGAAVYCPSTNAIITNCVMVGNKSFWVGGGTRQGTLISCVLSNNTAELGGGIYQSVLNNCLLIANRCSDSIVNGNSTLGGGGAYQGILNNSAIVGNSSDASGGGIYQAFVNNCTVCGNSAVQSGGGTYGGSLENCIVYYNTAATDSNYSGGTLGYCCTTPLPSVGIGNTSADPFLADAFHLSAISPCRGSGLPGAAIGVDIDNEVWNDPPAIGCDEYYPFGQSGPLSVSLQTASTNLSTGFPLNLMPQIYGHAFSNIWDFGDGQFLTNHAYPTSHMWTIPGDYTVVLRVFNDIYPNGITASIQVHVSEELHYVSIASTNPVPPYNSWATAATNIQDALDTALFPGARVLVAPGVYQTGGRALYGAMTNRVIVTNSVILQSLSGPAVTFIQGNQIPGAKTGDGAVRCVYLASNAVLSGFTITNGATRSSGDPNMEQSGGGIWCSSTNAIITNCFVVGCSAMLNGGGVYRGLFKKGIIRNNSADTGAGAYGSILIGSSLSRNNAISYGGGADASGLLNCTVLGNSASLGGGIESCSARNCVVFYNAASQQGANYLGGSLDYSCTDTLPSAGIGNITSEPQLADLVHVSGSSPCIGAGALPVADSDIDGESWANSPSIGCDEYHPGAITGPLTVAIQAPCTNVTFGMTLHFTAQITGHADSNRWAFGDSAVANNLLFASHSWSGTGTFPVVLEVFNQDYPGGIRATSLIQVVTQPIHYVNVANSSPITPFNSWATAATNIQDAVDAATAAGALVLVSNGVYRSGGRAVFGAMTNRVVISKPITVQSVNGPQVTSIEGYSLPGTTNGDGAIRCVYVADGAQLSGFTLTNGATRSSGINSLEMRGGGVWCESQRTMVSNCVISGNAAAEGGAGAYQGSLNNCLISKNTGPYGAGILDSIVINSTLNANIGRYGGGGNSSRLYNCLISSNNALGLGGGVTQSVLTNCTLLGNKSSWGGGAMDSTLQTCAILSNSVFGGFGGGGCYNCNLSSCLVMGNSSDSVAGTYNCLVNGSTIVANTGGDFGGDYGSTLDNSIVYYNTGSWGPNHYYSTFTYSCALALPDGPGNFTNAPLFVDLAVGNLRLQSNSPCINSGNNLLVTNSADLDGNPRIRGGTVDVGAYEFQSPTSMPSYLWLQQYGLPTDGSADFVDTDADSMNNWQEWIAGTVPTDGLSVLKMLLPSRTNTASTVLNWLSVTNRTYFLLRSTNLVAQPAFSMIYSNILGQPGTTTFLDTNAGSVNSAFYRVGVQ